MHEYIQAKHAEIINHINNLKKLDTKQKNEITALKKRIHDIEIA